ncbi:hypothetical protein KCP73_25610 [Salmonella enterica subsp. enterica]|nr:hypothetical protein KCP73_25610 [Salmonella enterica subsp. enterica]
MQLDQSNAGVFARRDIERAGESVRHRCILRFCVSRIMSSSVLATIYRCGCWSCADKVIAYARVNHDDALIAVSRPDWCSPNVTAYCHNRIAVSKAGTDIIIPGQLNQHRYTQCAYP